MEISRGQSYLYLHPGRREDLPMNTWKALAQMASNAMRVWDHLGKLEIEEKRYQNTAA